MRIVPELSRCAILVVELQNDVVHESNLENKGLARALAAEVAQKGLLDRVAILLQAARQKDIPVLYINVANRPGIRRPRARIYDVAEKQGPILQQGTWGAETHDKVTPQAEDFVLERTISVDGSVGTGLYGILHQLGRDQLILTGISTALAVEGLVRASLNRGLECWVAEDCCAAAPPQWHDWSIQNILPLLSTVTTAEEIAAHWNGREG